MFRTDLTPHTSFGRPEATSEATSVTGGDVRYSVEMRCAAIVVDGDDASRIAGAIIFLLLLGVISSFNPRVKKKT